MKFVHLGIYHLLNHKKNLLILIFSSSGTGRIPRLHGTDAKGIYKRATASDGAPFQLDVGCKSMLHQNQQTTKNHLNENLKRIRRIMKDSQKRQDKKAQTQPIPVKALWHSKQYDHVQSKVKQTLEEVILTLNLK